MLAFGEVRMAVPYQRAIYVDARGQVLGASPDIAESLGEFLSNKYKKNIRVRLIPTVPGRLLDAIDDGSADFAQIFDQEYNPRLQSGDYLQLTHPHFEEDVLVSRTDTTPIADLQSLSGKTVCMARLSDPRGLNKVNQLLKQAGKPLIDIYTDRFVLDDVDFLQMLDAGLIEYAFVARWKATLWSKVFKNIRINESTASASGSPGNVVVKRQNKQLADDILSYASSPFVEKALERFRKKDFEIRKNALNNPLTPVAWDRFLSMENYFKKYGHENHLDPLFLAGLGFQESGLNQAARSPAGAIGVMQLLLITGNSLKVGDIHQLEPNIHAGAKYIDALLYATSIKGTLSPIERSIFAVAAYNAGPNTIKKARDLAASMGFDPNRWFLNVEMATAKLFGEQTFLYVRNVYKYYVTYDLRQSGWPISHEKLMPIQTKYP